MNKHTRPFTPQLLLLLALITASGYSQPIIRVHGNTDSSRTKHFVHECLNQLNVYEDFLLVVRYSKDMPRTQPGLTFYQGTNSLPIVWVWIKANLNRKLQRTVLIHEMIHVKQFAKGELMINNDQDIYWEGEKYRNNGSLHSSDSPWEFEAHRDDGKLAKLLLRSVPQPWLSEQLR